MTDDDATQATVRSASAPAHPSSVSSRESHTHHVGIALPSDGSHRRDICAHPACGNQLRHGLFEGSPYTLCEACSYFGECDMSGECGGCDRVFPRISSSENKPDPNSRSSGGRDKSDGSGSKSQKRSTSERSSERGNEGTSGSQSGWSSFFLFRV